MIRKLDLIAQLQRIPGNPCVTTWAGKTLAAAPACETHIEEIAVANDATASGERVIVLGLEIDTQELGGEVELTWNSTDE